MNDFEQNIRSDQQNIEKSCWDCKYQRIVGDTFLGICTWFSTRGKENKQILPSVVDDGCKFFEPR